MKIKIILIAVSAALLCGCQEQNKVVLSDSQIQSGCIFVPAEIKFNRLTEFKDNWRIDVYVDMLDQFANRIKAAGAWRFELYQYQPRSPQPKGQRVYIWPDMILTMPAENQAAWQDYLRCYKFVLKLDIDIESDKMYILSATCTTPSGRRLTDNLNIKM